MSPTDLLISRSDLGDARLVESVAADAPLADGQVLIEVDQFALTTNNMSYARAGDRMGYWNFFPAPDAAADGRLPVWGYATVVRSECPQVLVGEEVFGYLPVGRRWVMAPNEVSDLAWMDASPHLDATHPWYSRYYRTANDPVTQAGFRETQPVLWALFMTGWEMANDLIADTESGASTVVVASASSKTAWSLAWSLRDAPHQVVGLTSPGNVDFTESLGCYDHVVAYDEFDPAAVGGTAVFVDMAGNETLARTIHEGFGERLVRSVRIGGTHRGAGASPGDMPGPARSFFFIPDVAETKAAAVGQADYHAGFAAAWSDFATWSRPLLRVEHQTGGDAMLAAYLAMQSGATDPTLAQLYSYA